jgi:hypothetical protein
VHRIVIILVAITVAPAMIIMLFHVLVPRPLFHEWLAWNRPTWSLIQPVRDATGTWAFFDPPCNMVVLVVTGDKDQYECPSIASSSQACLLCHTPYEVAIHRQPNTLIIVQPHVISKSVRLEPGAAQSLQLTLHQYVAFSGGPKEVRVLDAILTQYTGPDAEQLRALIHDHFSGQ